MAYPTRLPKLAGMEFPFRIVPAAQNAYRLLSAERLYVLRLAFFPTVIKLVCYVTGLTLGYEDNVLRMSLILVPASLVEGWMLAHLVRLIVLGQRWPFRPSGNDEADIAMLEPRMRGVLGGLITYTLINLLIAGAMALVMGGGSGGVEADAAEITASPLQATLMMAMMAAGIWGFPLLWLYIPVAGGMDVRRWIDEIRGLKFSLPLMGVWLLCYLPIAALTIFGVSAILSPFETGAIPTGARFAVIIIGVILDTAKSLLGTAGITFALMDYYHNKRADGRA